MKKLSKSFVTGAVALVFAVLGYQTALLVHYSATARIIANRDCPDTVFVWPPAGQDPGEGPVGGDAAGAGADRPGAAGAGYARPGAAGAGADRPGASNPGSSTVRGQDRRQGQGGGRHVRRSNAPHSAGAQRFRSSLPARHVESFPFDPNTVPAEDLVRLGFSPAQAQSICNYRSKGGRFRRKEDFARSYVVSDSIFRRLEPYITIPKIDLNRADSAAFDSLPGIGGYFARKMVEYRTRLHGYSYPEQLMDIYHFDREKYDALSDLITLSPADPYPLWSLPEDSLRLHPYIGGAAVARSIVFFRQHNSQDRWTTENLAAAGVLQPGQASKLGRCRIANP